MNVRFFSTLNLILAMLEFFLEGIGLREAWKAFSFHLRNRYVNLSLLQQSKRMPVVCLIHSYFDCLEEVPPYGRMYIMSSPSFISISSQTWKFQNICTVKFIPSNQNIMHIFPLHIIYYKNCVDSKYQMIVIIFSD